MLIPLAAADPPRGALVNVVGTVNVFEADKRRGLTGVAYASSAAVYDRSDGVRVAEGADVRNVGGPSEHVADVVAAIEEVLPEAVGQITFKQDVLLPLPDDMEASQPQVTPLRQGALETIESFRRSLR